VFAKYARRREVQEQATTESPAEREVIRQELKYRILAVPVALAIARLSVATVPFLTRMLSMMVHESGHAVSAWICGYGATPGIWFTPISDDRSIWVPVFLVAGMSCLSYWARQTKRPHVIAACAGIVILQVIGWRLFYIDAQALIAFGGDGGSLVLGTLLMTTFYARRDSVLYVKELRWGFLGLGAVSFMDAFHTWTGSEDDIAFGEQNGVQTDPSMLVENYGWSIQLMVDRYVRLATICLIALAIVYLFGILRTRKELNANG
jgi:hypothetical protein